MSINPTLVLQGAVTFLAAIVCADVIRDIPQVFKSSADAFVVKCIVAVIVLIIIVLIVNHYTVPHSNAPACTPSNHTQH